MLTQFKNQLAKSLLVSAKAIVVLCITFSSFASPVEVKSDFANKGKATLDIDNPRKPRL